MKKIFLKLSLLAAICLASAVFISCKNDESEQGGEDTNTPGSGSVVINGVTWATRNVDKFGTFAEHPESSGMLYQWNRSKAWTDTVTFIGEGEKWDSTTPGGYKWEEENDPSPEGWRLPTVEEIKRLLDIKKVTGEWIIRNGVNGYRFTDKSTNASIFLPAAGYRDGGDGRLRGAGSSGMYWSAESTSSNVEIEEAYYIESGGNGAILGDYHKRNRGFSLRCVRK